MNLLKKRVDPAVKTTLKSLPRERKLLPESNLMSPLARRLPRRLTPMKKVMIAMKVRKRSPRRLLPERYPTSPLARRVLRSKSQKKRMTIWKTLKKMVMTKEPRKSLLVTFPSKLTRMLSETDSRSMAPLLTLNVPHSKERARVLLSSNSPRPQKPRRLLRLKMDKTLMEETLKLIYLARNQLAETSVALKMVAEVVEVESPLLYSLVTLASELLKTVWETSSPKLVMLRMSELPWTKNKTDPRVLPMLSLRLLREPKRPSSLMAKNLMEEVWDLISPNLQVAVAEVVAEVSVAASAVEEVVEASVVVAVAIEVAVEVSEEAVAVEVVSIPLDLLTGVTSLPSKDRDRDCEVPMHELIYYCLLSISSSLDNRRLN
jgi:hypothetical protein